MAGVSPAGGVGCRGVCPCSPDLHAVVLCTGQLEAGRWAPRCLGTKTTASSFELNCTGGSRCGAAGGAGRGMRLLARARALRASNSVLSCSY